MAEMRKNGEARNSKSLIGPNEALLLETSANGSIFTGYLAQLPDEEAIRKFSAPFDLVANISGCVMDAARCSRLARASRDSKPYSKV